MSSETGIDVTVAIPTYGRGKVLLETLAHLFAQSPAAKELLVADQTPEHSPEVEGRLKALEAGGRIRRLRLPRPSITAAMNALLREASCPIVLFVDDDIVPLAGLVGAHAAAHGESAEIWAVTGQVLQPGEEPFPGRCPFTESGLRAGLDFCFRSTARAWVRSVMAGNLSVRRKRALEIGGFDENFVGAAYRFETEFCRRVWRAGGRVLYEPAAGIRHLRATSGGTRRFGNHLSSMSPAHGVGDYYFALRHGLCVETLLYMLKRPFRETCTRFHLRRPWYIPVKWIGEGLAALWAVGLAARGARTAIPRGKAGATEDD